MKKVKVKPNSVFDRTGREADFKAMRKSNAKELFIDKK